MKKIFWLAVLGFALFAAPAAVMYPQQASACTTYGWPGDFGVACVADKVSTEPMSTEQVSTKAVKDAAYWRERKRIQHERQRVVIFSSSRA
jgi:hypothetical protein